MGFAKYMEDNLERFYENNDMVIDQFYDDSWKYKKELVVVDLGGKRYEN